MKHLLGILLVVVMLLLTGCQDGAQIAKNNLTKSADNFELNRRIVFVNGITDNYLLSIEGLCSVENDGRRLSVICRVSDTEFKRHFLGLSDNVTYVIEQLEPAVTSQYRYRVIFRPESILPKFEVMTSK